MERTVCLPSIIAPDTESPVLVPALLNNKNFLGMEVKSPLYVISCGVSL